jgi:hypothetical protein
MNHWYPMGELARQHQDELQREATGDALVRATRTERTERGIAVLLAGMKARLGVGMQGIVRRDHALTDYPCRLQDGSIGRVAVVLGDGEWTLVCRAA